MVASVLCAVHCVASAVLVGAPAITSLLDDPRLEFAFVVVAIGVALVALGRAYRRHHSRTSVLVGALGVVLLLMTRLGPLDTKGLETGASVVGGLLLVTAHALNIRAMRRADACCV